MINCGKLDMIIGPMFSGKSTALIRYARLFTVIKKSFIVVKPKMDTRYGDNNIVSHNFEKVECKMIDKLEEITKEVISNLDALIIDEGQFFPDLKSKVVEWIDNYNIHIIVGGLDGSFEKKPIGQILELIPHSNKCKKYNSVCNICKNGEKAIFTLRKSTDNSEILIGGEESYIPVCRKCYLENKK